MLAATAIAGLGVFGGVFGAWTRREGAPGRSTVSGAAARDYAQETDEALLARSAGGDRLAFDHLAGRHLERAYRIALRIVGSAAEAEDVAQEAMVRVWENAARFDPTRAKFSTWCYRIIVNLALSQRRRPTALVLDAALEVADPGDDAEALIARREAQAGVVAALDAMPERQRAALVLVYYEEMSAVDAAEVLDVSTRALEGLLRRGRQFIRERLASAAIPDMGASTEETGERT
jgi:RNA polymerase sigma-70 factor (ECF subfamily)